MRSLLIVALFAGTTSAAAQNCAPPNDTPLACPGKYMPTPRTTLTAAEKNASPDSIALIILHETSHWVDKSAVGGRRFSYDPQTAYRAEARAYSQQADFAGRLGLTTEETVDRAKTVKYLEQAETSEREHLTFEQIKVRHPEWLSAAESFGTAYPSQDGSEDQKARGESEFTRGLNGMASLSRQSQADAAERIADRDARDRQAKAEDDARFKRLMEKQEAEESAAYAYIKTSAGLACSNPSAFESQIAGGEAIGVGIDSESLFFRMERDRHEVGWASLTAHLKPCQENVMSRLLDAPGPVSARTLSQWADEYRMSREPAPKKPGTSVGEYVHARDAAREATRESRRDDDGAAAERFRKSMEDQNHELGKYDDIVHRVFYGDGDPDFDQRHKH